MILYILTLLVIIFALYWTIKIKKTFPAIITLGMIAGIVMVFSPSEITKTWGFYVYMAFTVIAFVYGLIVKELTRGSRITICLLSVSIFIYWLWVLNHWHGNTLVAPIFTLLVALTSIFYKVRLKNELAFVTLLVVDAVLILIEQWMKMSG